ncbi:MAG: hypothetical protein HZY79_13950 [Rhodoblastus sp.]|nr:MAG: hypothetical protein HZY79_13950 [Rhodoblastus sp.]
MPQPVSITSMAMELPSGRASNSTAPPSPVNFTALETRLVRICRQARLSATSSAARGSRVARNATPPCSALSRIISMTCSTTPGNATVSGRNSNRPASIFDTSSSEFTIDRR